MSNQSNLPPITHLSQVDVDASHLDKSITELKIPLAFLESVDSDQLVTITVPVCGVCDPSQGFGLTDASPWPLAGLTADGNPNLNMTAIEAVDITGQTYPLLVTANGQIDYAAIEAHIASGETRFTTLTEIKLYFSADSFDALPVEGTDWGIPFALPSHIHALPAIEVSRLSDAGTALESLFIEMDVPEALPGFQWHYGVGAANEDGLTPLLMTLSSRQVLPTESLALKLTLPNFEAVALETESFSLSQSGDRHSEFTFEKGVHEATLKSLLDTAIDIDTLGAGLMTGAQGGIWNDFQSQPEAIVALHGQLVSGLMTQQVPLASLTPWLASADALNSHIEQMLSTVESEADANFLYQVQLGLESSVADSVLVGLDELDRLLSDSVSPSIQMTLPSDTVAGVLAETLLAVDYSNGEISMSQTLTPTHPDEAITLAEANVELFAFDLDMPLFDIEEMIDTTPSPTLGQAAPISALDILMGPDDWLENWSNEGADEVAQPVPAPQTGQMNPPSQTPHDDWSDPPPPSEWTT